MWVTMSISGFDGFVLQSERNQHHEQAYTAVVGDDGDTMRECSAEEV